MALLEVTDLKTYFETDDGIVKAVDGVSFSVDKGKTLGIVGESGSGKSVTCLTIMGLNAKKNTITSGEANFKGENLIGASSGRLREIRGNDIAMIFQDPMTSLNPVHTIGTQLIEAVQLHRDVEEVARARARVAEAVGIPRAERRIDDYPHQFSGGMRQRAMIAMALAKRPRPSDRRPDVTTRTDHEPDEAPAGRVRERDHRHHARLGRGRRDRGRRARHVCGRVAEQAPVEKLFNRPQHPYTWGLLGSLPRLDTDVERLYRSRASRRRSFTRRRAAGSIRDHRTSWSAAGRSIPSSAPSRRIRNISRRATSTKRRRTEKPRSCSRPRSGRQAS